MSIWNGNVESQSGDTEKSHLGTINQPQQPPLPPPPSSLLLLQEAVAENFASTAPIDPSSAAAQKSYQNSGSRIPPFKYFTSLASKRVNEKTDLAAKNSTNSSYLRKLSEYLTRRRTTSRSSTSDVTVSSVCAVVDDANSCELVVAAVVVNSDGASASSADLDSQVSSSREGSSSSTLELQKVDSACDIKMVSNLSDSGSGLGSSESDSQQAIDPNIKSIILPRVFLKPGAPLENTTTTANNVSNSGSEKGYDGSKADRQPSQYSSTAEKSSSGYYSSQLYSTSSVEEHIYSEPTIIIEPSLTPPPLSSLPTSISIEAAAIPPSHIRSDSSTLTKSNKHNRSSSAIINEVVDQEEVDDDVEIDAQLQKLASVNNELSKAAEEFSIRFHQQLPACCEVASRMSKAFTFNVTAHNSNIRMGLEHNNKYFTDCTRRNHPQRKLPTIMEGIDGQIPRPIWPSDMDDSLMDINLDSFLYANEKKKNHHPALISKRAQNDHDSSTLAMPPHLPQSSPPPHATPPLPPPLPSSALPSLLRDHRDHLNEEDIENNYRCIKYVNSCPDNPYRVVEDIQLSVDKSLAFYLKKCDESVTMQNTRDFLEEIRAKLNSLLESHSANLSHYHSKPKMSADHIDGGGSVAGGSLKSSIAVIEDNIKSLKGDLDKYLKLMNQTNELEIKQLCTGLAKDSRLQTLQNAMENRYNSNSSSYNQQHLHHPYSIEHRNSMTTAITPNPIQNPFLFASDRIINGGDRATAIDDNHYRHANDDDNSINVINNNNTYETMRDKQQNMNIISQYPENDLSSYFDTVYVHEGFNLGYKINASTSSVRIKPHIDEQRYVGSGNRKIGNNVNTTTTTRQSISSSDPNFQLKRKSSLNLQYGDRCVESELIGDYEIKCDLSDDVTNTASNSSSPEESDHQQKQQQRNSIVKSQMQQNLMMQQHSTLLKNLSKTPIMDQDLIHEEWHKNKPSIWELYYGINRPKHQKTLVKKSKQGKKKAISVIPYPSTRPESDFTLDLPRAEQLQLKMKKEKQFRSRCKIFTSFLSLIFFLVTVMIVSLVLTRGKRMFGSMI